MPTIAEQLTKLIELKTELANNLTIRGIEISSSATFNDLVPQVLNVEDVTDETTTYTNLNTKLRNVINSLPSSKEIALQEKTITPASFIQTVEPDSGYDGLSKVTVDAMPTVAQATPSITISSSGLITAKSMQLAGYVEGGTKTATNQLTTQGAKTITPSTSSQTAVASGVYTTGAITVAAIPSSYVKPTYTKGATTYTPKTSNQTIAAKTYCSGTQTIKGDTNLVASNIKSGVSIFGVSGSYEGSGGEDVSEEVAEYTDLNTELEEVINSLPSAGGGSSGGGSVELSYFKVNEYSAYEFPFIVGQTWGEWVETSLNIIISNSMSGYSRMTVLSGKVQIITGAGMGVISSANASGREVSLTDLIQPETTYYAYIDMSGWA